MEADPPGERVARGSIRGRLNIRKHRVTTALRDGGAEEQAANAGKVQRRRTVGRRIGDHGGLGGAGIGGVVTVDAGIGPDPGGGIVIRGLQLHCGNRLRAGGEAAHHGAGQ